MSVFKTMASTHVFNRITSEYRITLSVEDQPILTAYEASTFFSRLKGLHPYLPLSDDEALIIKPCSSIHTFTMKTSIDVVFVNASGFVLSCETIRPLRCKFVSQAVAVIEMKPGTCDALGLKAGLSIERNAGEWI